MCEIETPCDHFKSRGVMYAVQGEGGGYTFSRSLGAYFTAMSEVDVSFQEARFGKVDYEFLMLVGLRRSDLEAKIIPMHLVSHPGETARGSIKKN